MCGRVRFVSLRSRLAGEFSLRLREETMKKKLVLTDTGIPSSEVFWATNQTSRMF